MRAYYDRTQPLFLCGDASFDGVPVEAPESMVTFLRTLREIQIRLQDTADFGGAPEDIGQQFIDDLVAQIDKAIREYDA